MVSLTLLPLQLQNETHGGCGWSPELVIVGISDFVSGRDDP
jgi:hypothetical protein